jgi:hypothetical protein
MKSPDLEIYEAARNYLRAVEKSEACNAQARTSLTLAQVGKRELINLLHGLFDIQETMCLHLEDGELLVCHYDCEEGFVDFSKIQEFSEVCIYSETLNIPDSESVALDDPLDYFQHFDPA